MTTNVLVIGSQSVLGTIPDSSKPGSSIPLCWPRESKQSRRHLRYATIAEMDDQAPPAR